MRPGCFERYRSLISRPRHSGAGNLLTHQALGDHQRSVGAPYSRRLNAPRPPRCPFTGAIAVHSFALIPRPPMAADAARLPADGRCRCLSVTAAPSWRGAAPRKAQTRCERRLNSWTSRADRGHRRHWLRRRSSLREIKIRKPWCVPVQCSVRSGLTETGQIKGAPQTARLSRSAEVVGAKSTMSSVHLSATRKDGAPGPPLRLQEPYRLVTNARTMPVPLARSAHRLPILSSTNRNDASRVG